jgi:single-stranded-DNA-specific exonuclease
VTLGIAADVMPLTNENRIISHFGLEKIRAGNNLGLRALIETSKLLIEKIGIGQINFWVSPKINAAGRLGEASRAVKLLTSDNLYHALEIANDLNKENEKRKLITEIMENESISMIENDNSLKSKKSIVLYKEGWHSGIIGIVASRLKELYNKPTIIIGLENGIGKGSCRSIPQLDMVDALNLCSDLLGGYGGHPMAAGLTIKESKLDEFIERFNLNCSSQLDNKDLVPNINIDLEISMSDINTRMINFLKYMEPYGPKNPKPVFLSKRLYVDGIPKLLGRDQSTIKFNVKEKESIFQSIGFKMIDEYEKLISQRPIDMIYNISENHWKGRSSLQLEVKGIKYSDA